VEHRWRRDGWKRGDSVLCFFVASMSVFERVVSAGDFLAILRKRTN